MTKEQFIETYCQRSNISWDVLSKTKVVLPCACGDEICEGWVMLPNEQPVIETHSRLYAPKESESVDFL